MIIDTFSKRQRRLNQQTADVFTYDKVPIRLRNQIIHIINAALGDHGLSNKAYPWLHKTIAAEFGLLFLRERNSFVYVDDKTAICDFFREDATDDQALDMIELIFQAITDIGVLQLGDPKLNATMTPDRAVKDLNQRFLENGLGYAFTDGDDAQLIRKDNEHLHQEAVLPALHLLHEQGFKGANDEYRSAHEHYRHSKYKECLNDCLKAFESTLKTICQKRGWSFQPTDTAKILIKTCLDNGLLPSFADSHLTALRTNLEGTIPTVRNKLGGHGQGETPVTVPKFYAEFMLHDTAATIVFLVEAFKALP